MIQRLTDNGDVIVQFFCAVASGQPFTIRVVKELSLTKEQEAVAHGIATDATPRTENGSAVVRWSGLPHLVKEIRTQLGRSGRRGAYYGPLCLPARPRPKSARF